MVNLRLSRKQDVTCSDFAVKIASDLSYFKFQISYGHIYNFFNYQLQGHCAMSLTIYEDMVLVIMSLFSIYIEKNCPTLENFEINTF